MTTATHNGHDTTPERVLFVAFARSAKTWKLGFTTGHGQKPRERSFAAGHQARVLHEVAQAKRRFGLPETAPVVSCDEAGREGFWLHRFLEAQGITHSVVDSSSIEVNRRQRRAKRDGLDVRKLLSMLMRLHHGARDVWRVVPVPSVEAEDQRHLHRDLATLKQERASTTTRIQGLRRSQGLRLTSVSKFPAQLDAWRLGDGSPMPSGLRQRLLRVDAHHQFLSEQIAAWEAERRALRQNAQEASLEKVRQLLQLKGIGINGAWVLVMALFGWRAVKHRREGGGLSRRHADAVSQRGECPRPRDYQVREPPCALDDHGVGLELGALSAGECPEWLVSRALGWRWQAPETHWDGRGGASVTHCPGAIPGAWAPTRGGGTQRGVSGVSVLSQASDLGLVEAAR
jgi:transposase